MNETQEDLTQDFKDAVRDVNPALALKVKYDQGQSQMRALEAQVAVLDKSLGELYTEITKVCTHYEADGKSSCRGGFMYVTCEICGRMF